MSHALGWSETHATINKVKNGVGGYNSFFAKANLRMKTILKAGSYCRHGNRFSVKKYQLYYRNFGSLQFMGKKISKII